MPKGFRREREREKGEERGGGEEGRAASGRRATCYRDSRWIRKRRRLLMGGTMGRECPFACLLACLLACSGPSPFARHHHSPRSQHAVACMNTKLTLVCNVVAVGSVRKSNDSQARCPTRATRPPVRPYVFVENDRDRRNSAVKETYWAARNGVLKWA